MRKRITGCFRQRTHIKKETFDRKKGEQIHKVNNENGLDEVTDCGKRHLVKGSKKGRKITIYIWKT